MGFAFEELQVYQRALDFAVSVIDIVEEMDTPRKHYRLIEQLEVSCTSVALNMHSERIPRCLQRGLASEYDAFYLAYGDSPQLAAGELQYFIRKRSFLQKRI